MGQIKYLLRYISIWLLAKALLQLKKLASKPYNLVELIYDEAEWKQWCSSQFMQYGESQRSKEAEIQNKSLSPLPRQKVDAAWAYQEAVLDFGHFEWATKLSKGWCVLW